MTVVQQVTRDNFEELLPAIKAAISTASFVTIDTELTGLQSSRANHYNVLDTPQQRYTKVRNSASNFGLIQYGLACFHWNPSTNQYDTQCWSFYLWPKTGTSADCNRHMLLQLSSIEFLAKHGYDFNKTFHQGISYINRADEAYKRAHIEKLNEAANEQQQKNEDVDVEGLNDDDKQFLQDHYDGITAHFASSMSDGPYEIPPINGFRRRLIHQQVPKRFEGAVPGKVVHVVKTGKDRHAGMQVSFLTPDEHSSLVTDTYHQSIDELMKDIGFRHLIDHIAAEGKAVIGHNCFMDLCHTFNKFIDHRLPESYEEFKQTLHTIFPLIMDTKYVAASIQEMHGSESTSLGDLYHFLAKHPVASDACHLMEDGVEERFHDAGFDAYCTGQVFNGLAALIAQRDGLSLSESVDSILSNPEMANRLFMMQSADMNGMNLAGPEDIPDRSTIIRISGFDPSCRTSHIQAALAATGITVEPRSIIWHDEESLFVRLESVEQAVHLAGLSGLKIGSGKATVETYEKYYGVPNKRRLSESN